MYITFVQRGQRRIDRGSCDVRRLDFLLCERESLPSNANRTRFNPLHSVREHFPAIRTTSGAISCIVIRHCSRDKFKMALNRCPQVWWWRLINKAQAASLLEARGLTEEVASGFLWGHFRLDAQWGMGESLDKKIEKRNVLNQLMRLANFRYQTTSKNSAHSSQNKGGWS